MLPIAHVNHLSKGTEGREPQRLSDTSNLILDAVWKSIVEHMAEGAFAIATDLGG